MIKLLKGNNLDLLKELPDNSVDSVVTDGPYGLTFMNKKWDYDVPNIELWKEVYRVLKPGGYVLSFGGTRTYHRMVVNIEDAGFEIRDQIMWLYGSGFPKSHNIGKAVDKLEGNEREVVGKLENYQDKRGLNGQTENVMENAKPRIDIPLTKGQSEWEGWGTALKPANEPICVARKPLSEKSVAENVLKWGVGGINIDGCRVGSEGSVRKTEITKIPNSDSEIFKGANIKCKRTPIEGEGRFPANLILECICDEVIKGEKGDVKKTTRNRSSMKDNGYGFGEEIEATDDYNDKGDIHLNPDCPCRLLDEQSGISKSKKSLMGSAQSGNDEGRYNWNNGDKNDFKSLRGHNDKGGASRFFYQAKVSKKERNMGLDGFEEKTIHDDNNKYGLEKFNTLPKKNHHPTIKSVNLMSYLCRLITPPNGVILDPFMGSGSTGIGALLEGFSFIGMEQDEEYFKIAESRIEKYEKYREFLK